MRYLSPVWLIYLVIVCVNCSSNGTETNPFTKQVEVFGIRVIATTASPDDKVLHAANVLAEYLDNDGDGIPDNQKIIDAMAAVNVSLMITKNPDELAAVRMNYRELMPRPSKSVWADNIGPRHGVDGFNDEAIEEVLHMITRHGYGNAYPEVFGMTSGTELSRVLDIARGGHFEEVPEEYPEGAWYTYYDETCLYSCQMNEYIYWVITSLLGSQDFPGRLESIGDEWPLNTREKVRERDPAAYALTTNPQYKLPTVLPDGNYNVKTFTIQKYP